MVEQISRTLSIIGEGIFTIVLLLVLPLVRVQRPPYPWQGFLAVHTVKRTEANCIGISRLFRFLREATSDQVRETVTTPVVDFDGSYATKFGQEFGEKSRRIDRRRANPEVAAKVRIQRSGRRAHRIHDNCPNRVEQFQQFVDLIRCQSSNLTQ